MEAVAYQLKNDFAFFGCRGTEDNCPIIMHVVDGI